MNTLFESQIIFIYNSEGNITKTIFLTYDENNLINSKHYQIYEYYKKNIDIFISDDYEIIHNHILLTLTIGEIRAYIRNQILKTNLKILLFSLWNNIDYINKNESIFNPFDLENQIFEKVPDTTLIYKIYNQVAFITIFCVLDEYSIAPELCSEGIYKEEIYDFVSSIMNYTNENLENLDISVEKNDKIIYNINKQKYLFYDFQNITYAKKTINEMYNFYGYVSGNDLKLLKRDHELLNIYISVFDNNDKEILTIDNDILTIFDIEEYNKILLMFPKLENLIIKQKITKQNIKIEYNISLGVLILDYDIDFFIEDTKKTKNIFLDRSKSINIITSNNHTYFSTYQTPQINLYIYIIKFIIGIQLLKNKVNFLLIDKKKGNRYFSRYCQGVRNPEKIDINTINKDDFIIHEDIYYENKNDTGDIFFNNEIQQYVQCKHKNIYNIGFIKELYHGYNICYPCCYKKKKNDNDIFKNCIYNLGIKERINYDPYIHIFKQYRVIVDNYKLSLLLNKINDLFNLPDSISFKKLDRDRYIYLNKYNKIEEARNYVIYTTNKDNIDFKNLESIKDNHSPCLFFLNNDIYYNQNIIPDYYKNSDSFLENFKFYIIIQNKLHIIQTIDKKYNDSNIILKDIDINIKKQIIDKYFLNTFINYINSEQVPTKYLYKINNINLNPNTLGYYIVNVLYKDYFNTIYPINDEDIILYKVTFLINLLNISKIDIDFNINFDIHHNIKLIHKLVKYLNVKFIEKKELNHLNEYSRRI